MLETVRIRQSHSPVSRGLTEVSIHEPLVEESDAAAQCDPNSLPCSATGAMGGSADIHHIAAVWKIGPDAIRDPP